MGELLPGEFCVEIMEKISVDAKIIDWSEFSDEEIERFIVELEVELTFRPALVIFTNIGRQKAPCRAVQGGEAMVDVPR
jgi:hypothetical protein